jgi:hypothetical protein
LKMHRTEDEILQRLGIGPVFAAHSVSDRALPSRRKTGRTR